MNSSNPEASGENKKAKEESLLRPQKDISEIQDEKPKSDGFDLDLDDLDGEISDHEFQAYQG